MNLRLVRRGPWSVYAVCTDRGDCPLLDFLYEGSVEQPTGERVGKSREAKERVRMLARLKVVSENGPPHNTEICHQIEEGIWQIETGRIRVLWFYDEGKIIVASHGFVKRTKRTPEAEKRPIREALRRYREAKAARQIIVMQEREQAK